MVTAQLSFPQAGSLKRVNKYASGRLPSLALFQSADARPAASDARFARSAFKAGNT